MCGIAGILSRGDAQSEALARNCELMGLTLSHRGPDSDGRYVSQDGLCALAHTRLSIIDLSNRGLQPMVSNDGRYVIVYNGEIYNYRELRSEFKGRHNRSWGSGSDTEVLLALIEERGISAALSAIDGMFAFAVWDKLEQQLTLARDRFGEKPLYYGHARGAFGEAELIFGSELKSLVAHPGFQRRIDNDARSLYLRLGYVPAPYSIFSDANKLPPGSFLQVGKGFSVDRLVPTPYWSPSQRIAELRSKELCERPQQGTLESVLTDSVRRRLISDVPIGVFLSSGIDSSLTAALAKNVVGSQLETFSIGFDDPEFDEAPFAKRIADHLGVRHETLYTGKDEALAVIPYLAETYDEPFSDSSQIPTMVLSKLARTHVTVALSGDGGDELFGGYNRHSAARLFDKVSVLPTIMRRALGSTLRSRGLLALATRSSLLLNSHLADVPQLSLKLEKVAQLLDSESLVSAYEQLISVRMDDQGLVRGRGNQDLLGVNLEERLVAEEQFMLADTVGYLPGDILTKVDRASMAYGLEVRTPFLSEAVFDCAWAVFGENRIRGKEGKAPLRDLLARFVPRALWERPKAGFAVPLDRWLRKELRDWAESILERGQHNQSLESEAVQAHWNRFIDKRGVNAYQVWNILMYLDWHDRWSGSGMLSDHSTGPQ